MVANRGRSVLAAAIGSELPGGSRRRYLVARQEEPNHGSSILMRNGFLSIGYRRISATTPTFASVDMCYMVLFVATMMFTTNMRIEERKRWQTSIPTSPGQAA